MDCKLKSKKRRKWYEKYLPFVVRSPEMQVEWIVSVLRKGVLTHAEITPYIRILLDENENGDGKKELLLDLVNGLDEELQNQFFLASDIYDIPKLFSLIKKPTVEQAVIAIGKSIPPYEKKPFFVLNKVFQAVHSHSPELLEEAALKLQKSGDAPDHFASAYEKFQEIVEDEKILSALYPKAR